MKSKGIAIAIASVLIASFSVTSSHAATKNPYGDSAVDPAPANAVILTLSKGAKSTTYTFSQLKAMKSKTISIYEPFVKVRQSFTVIPLADLFKKVSISGKDMVQTIALNDYIYSNTAADFTGASGYLAIARNGKVIPYNQGGPIRIVFPDGSKWSKFLDPWNWSLNKLVVK